MSSVNLKRQKKVNSQMSEVMDEFDRFEYFFASHWKKIVAVAVLAVLAVGVYAIIAYAMKRNNEKAAMAYSSAKNLQELEAAVAQYKNPPSWVNVRMAAYYAEKKDYNKAVALLTQAAQDGYAPETQWSAMLNLAKVKELQGKYPEAAADALKLANVRVPGSAIFAMEGFMTAIHNYKLAGDKANALKTLEAAKKFIASIPPAQQTQSLVQYMLFLNVMSAEIDMAKAAK